jgi:hypothetical protein
MSFVKGQSWRLQARGSGSFAGAFFTSSFLVFGLVAAVGAATAKVVPSSAQVVAGLAVLAAALVLDLFSFKRDICCLVTVRRQTPKRILHDYGAQRAAIAWGLDTGLVFTTFRMSSITWALLALGVLGTAPWWVGIRYATGFVVPLVLGLVAGRMWRIEPTVTVLAEQLSRLPSVARSICIAALGLAVIAAGASLA